MSGSYLASGKPSWATTMWVDDNAVYMELPVTDGPAFITRYEFSEGGLSKALGMMRDLHREKNPDNRPLNLTKHPIIAASAKAKVLAKTRVPEASTAQRDNARAVLKRLKVIP